MILILVTGCASNRTLFKQNQSTFIRPPLPAKMELREIEWKFVNVNSVLPYERPKNKTNVMNFFINNY